MDKPIKFERTGEYRSPKKGEWIEASELGFGAAQVLFDYNENARRWILRPILE